MAKSFHTILNEGIIEVSHLGEKETFELPEWLTGAKDILGDMEALVAWAQEEEVMHGLLHSGIQQEIIRIRAASRPTINSYADVNKYNEAIGKLVVKDHFHMNDRDCQISKRLSCDTLDAQSRIDDYVCKEVKKPGGTKKAEVTTESAIEKLLSDGLTPEEIMKKIQVMQNK